MNDWTPSATLELLRLRARMLERIRAFFAARGVLEVDTPCLGHAAATDPHLASFSVRYTGPGHPHGAILYLHTSPEFAMKRLLAAGSGPIYQICHVFRDAECGRLHNPEFTLLEWYRPGCDPHALMQEVAQLIVAALAGMRTLASSESLSYREAFVRYAGLDPHGASGEDFAWLAEQRGLAVPATLAREDLDGWRDLVLTQLVAPHLGRNRLTFLYDYPASQAALARVRPGDPPVAERFECYLDGIELANGFHELGDPLEQRRRFERDLAARRARGLPEVPIDERLLAALAHGLPDCSGVALGVDRLVMCAVGAQSIAEVLGFPLERA